MVIRDESYFKFSYDNQIIAVVLNNSFFERDEIFISNKVMKAYIQMDYHTT